MKVGDIAYLKDHKSVLGEIKHIDDSDTVTLSLCDTGTIIAVNMADIGVTDTNQPHRDSKGTVNILGTQYKILIVEEGDYCCDSENDGWCDVTAKEILVFNYKQSVQSVKDLIGYQKKVIRHEIVHAFLYESGLWQNAFSSNCWAKNEEMVDWIAIQEPKIHKAFIEAGCAE